MRPLAVNFVRRRSIWPWLGYALSIALLAVAAFQSWSALASMKQVRLTEEEVLRISAAVDAKRKPPAGTPTQKAAEMPYAQDAAALAKLAGFDTGRVLAALESAQIVGVKVTALDILPAERVARVELEVADPTALLKFLEQINAGLEPARGWQLTRAQSPTPATTGTATVVLRGDLPP